MNKNTNTIWRLILLFIFTILSFTSYVYVVSGENEATGFTVKSITSSNIISNSESLKKSNVTILIGANGGGHSIYGDFGNETITKYLNNVLIKHPFKIEMGKVEEQLTYTILNEGMLFKYEYHIINTTDIWTGALCDNSTFCFPIRYTPGITVIGDDRIYAVNRIPIGMHGTLSYPDIDWKSEMTITVNGIPYTQNIGSGAGVAGSVNFKTILNEFVANAKWDGSLVTGQATPTQTNYIPTYISSKKEWNIAPKTYYDDYVKSLADIDTIFNHWKSINYKYSYRDYVCGFTIDGTCDIVLKYINDHNNALDKLVNANVNIGYGSLTSSTSNIISKRENSKVYGYVIDKLDRRFGNPEIIITTTATNIGIYIPTGTPKIQEITTDVANSGDGDSHIYIKVKNLGDYKGTFAAYLIDDKKIFKSSINVESSKIEVEPGKIATITLTMDSGTIIQNETIKGLVRVYDVNDPSNIDEKEVDLKSNIPKVCKPDSYREFSGNVYKCNSEGSDESLILMCDYLIKYVDGEPICEKSLDADTINKEELKSITSGDKEEPKEKEDKNDGILLPILYWLLGFLGLTSTFMIVNKIRNGEPKITKENMDKSMLWSGVTLGLIYIWLQYVALSEKLGTLLWLIIVFVIIITFIINVISFANTTKMLPIKISIVICIVLFIIITSIISGFKDFFCENPILKYIAGNCETFNLTKYIFGK